ncbi:hypothetical protein P8452_14744 [Trifolium repens]|nr:hypothetical protein P8452_14744 [Trifolium repens]
MVKSKEKREKFGFKDLETLSVLQVSTSSMRGRGFCTQCKPRIIHPIGNGFTPADVATAVSKEKREKFGFKDLETSFLGNHT